MIIHPARVIAGQDAAIHILWMSDGPEPQQPDLEQCFVTVPAGDGEVRSLAQDDFDLSDFEQLDDGGMYRVCFRPRNPDRVDWLRPNTQIELNLDLPGQGPIQVVIDPPFDGFRKIASAVEQSTSGIGDKIDDIVGDVRPPACRVVRDIGMAREDLDELVGYPMVTGNGAGPGTGSPAGSAQARIDAELQRLLGRRPDPSDVQGTLALLDRASQRIERADGVVRWEFHGATAPPVSGAGGAGITGRQSSLVSLGDDTIKRVEPLLAGLQSLTPGATTPGVIDSHRRTFLAALTDLAHQTAVHGGPVRARVQVLLEQAVDELAQLGEELSVLDEGVGNHYTATRDYVTDDADEQVFTAFLTAVERFRVFDGELRRYFDNNDGPVVDDVIDIRTDVDDDYGRRLTVWERRVTSIAAAVHELDRALTSVGITPAQRVRVLLAGDDGPSLDDIVTWAADLAEREARALLASSGPRGIDLLDRRLSALSMPVRELRRYVKAEDALPRGLRTRRVRNAVAQLAATLPMADADDAGLAEMRAAAEEVGN